MNETEIHDNHEVNAYSRRMENYHKLMEAGQLRRAKMHGAYLIDIYR